MDKTSIFFNILLLYLHDKRESGEKNHLTALSHKSKMRELNCLHLVNLKDDIFVQYILDVTVRKYFFCLEKCLFM